MKFVWVKDRMYRVDATRFDGDIFIEIASPLFQEHAMRLPVEVVAELIKKLNEATEVGTATERDEVAAQDAPALLEATQPTPAAHTA